ncbi:hypothetical protein Tco_0292248, partial [Tanacetum coccineum]
VAMGHPIDRLDIGRIPLLDSNLILLQDLSDQVLEIDPCAFDGFVSPLFESKDHVSKKRELRRECSRKLLGGVAGLVPVSLEEDASLSKRFLPAMTNDSF